MRTWLLLGLVVGACARPETCEDIRCGANARCVLKDQVPLCWCDLGFVMLGGRCVKRIDPVIVDAGIDPGLEDAGQLDAGQVDAGPIDAGVADAGRRCVTELQCEPGESCASGLCLPEELVVVFPDASVEVGVRVQMVNGFVLRSDGGSPSGVRLPARVELSSRQPWLRRPSDGETAPLDAQGRFGVSVAALPAAVVTLSTIVDARAAPASPGELHVTAVPPTGVVTVDFFTSDGGGFTRTARRDETVIARARVPRGLESIDVLPEAFVPARSCGCPDDEADAGQCLCFDVELWVPPFPVLEGRMNFDLVVTDRLGNSNRGVLANGNTLGLDVTRHRWEFWPTLGHMFSPLAVVDDQGVVYLTAFGNPPRGGIMAVRHDGTLKWERNLDTNVTGLAFSRGNDLLDPTDDVLFYTGNSLVAVGELDGGRVAAVWAATGIPLLGQCEAVGRSVSTLALIPQSNPDGGLAAIARFDPTSTEPGALCEWHPSVGGSAALQPMTGDPLEPAQGSVSPPQPSSGRSLLVARAASTNAPFEVVYPAAGPTFGVRRRNVLGGSSFGPSSSLTTQPIGWWTPSIGGLAWAGGANATSSGSFALMLQNEAWVVPQNTLRVVQGASHAVVDRQGRIWFGTMSGVSWLDPATGASGDVALPGPVEALILTEDAAGAPHRLYAVGRSVASVRLSPPSLEWSAPIYLRAGANTFDCNRTASPRARAATGILYGPGHYKPVSAIIVDSPRLDRQAPWPKHQRDVFNSANTDLRLDNCP